MRQFLPKTAIRLFLSLGCSPGQAGPNTSHFAVWQQMVGQILLRHPWAQTWSNSGEFWCHCPWAAPLLTEEPARRSQRQTWQRRMPNYAARHAAPSKIKLLFAVLRENLWYYSRSWIPRPIFVGLNHIFLFWECFVCPCCCLKDLRKQTGKTTD